MAGPTETMTHLRARGFTFVDDPSITEARALDLLAAMGLSNIVDAYRATNDAAPDPRLVAEGAEAPCES